MTVVFYREKQKKMLKKRNKNVDVSTSFLIFSFALFLLSIFSIVIGNPFLVLGIHGFCLVVYGVGVGVYFSG